YLTIASSAANAEAEAALLGCRLATERNLHHLQIESDLRVLVFWSNAFRGTFAT
ncbi:hypothetical protein GBA52_021323, partial [Prunus armeniaca]